MNARVFISCGQRKGSPEATVAYQVADILRQRGYDAYLALNDQTLTGLRENIFDQLKRTDYFLFIDFIRERINGVHRGSLFSHQELAIASFLDLPILAFRQSGVAEADGMLNAMQVNAAPFSDYEDVPMLVTRYLDDEEAAGRWTPHHPNVILFEDPVRYQRRSISRAPLEYLFFHVPVINQSRHRIARNAYLYLTQCWNEDTHQQLHYDIAESQWTGVKFPSINLFPGMMRKFDGVKFDTDRPHKAQFNIMTDDPSGLFIPKCDQVGNYLVEYTILSDNFLPAVQWFRLHIAKNWDATVLEKVDDVAE